jgi:tetratricopeptide (TPR) repeat protein
MGALSPRALALITSAACAASLLAAGCAPALSGPDRGEPPESAARLRAEAHLAGFELENPLELDPDMVADAEKAIRGGHSDQAKLHGLVDYLNAGGYLHFAYTPHRSLTARQAFREHRGDCMAYTHLFVALARHFGLPAYFVHITEVRDYYEKNGWFFVSSHVAVGQGSGPNASVIDFTKEIADWRLARYEAIDDGAALALFYNNVAVDLMTAGHTDQAEKLFRFLLEREPGVVELYNNLGVLLNRRMLHAEALAVLNRGITRYPEYEPLYTNALRAAGQLGRPDLLAWYERRGQEITSTDPYFLFARALTLFEQERFHLAARQFERASAAKPDSPVILAWLSRALFSAGRGREGTEAFDRARRLAPRDRLLDQIEAEHPELRRARD